MCVETLTGVLFWSSDLLGKPFRASCFPFETLSGSLLLCHLLFVSFHSEQILCHLPHNIFLRAGKNCYRYSFFFGEGRHRKKFFGPWVPTLAAATAARDQRFRQIVRTAWDARQRRRTGLGPAPGSWGR